MAFIIIDLEFNNLSGIHKCIPNVYTDNPNLKNLELDNEIIEIGAVKLDAHMQPCEELKVYIKPSVIPIINPKILAVSKEVHEDYEGCLSYVMHEGLVERPIAVKIETLDEHGEKKIYEAQDLLARCFMHEIDHLDGIMYVDRASEMYELVEEE